MLFIPTSGNRILVLCSFIRSKYCASGNHYSSKGEAIPYTVTCLLLLETIYYAFFTYVFLPVKADFWRSGNLLFLTNPSFRLVESEFLFRANSILLFVAFLPCCGNHY